MHQTSVTSLVDKLEAAGLIKRTPHLTDRRSMLAEITPAGRAQVQKAIKLLNSELFRDLGLSTHEVRTLITLLTKLRRSWADVERCATQEVNLGLAQPAESWAAAART